MLLEFIATNRDEITARTRTRLASRTAPHPTNSEMMHGVPLFLDQLASRLSAGAEPHKDQLSATASIHGGELLNAGFTIGQVVQDYGDICQAITELAVEKGPLITNEDFRTLNLCLDIAITDAVTEYARQSERAIMGRGVEHLGFLAHEIRNLLNTATLAFDAVQSGRVPPAGTTASIVEKSLAAMSDLISRSLAEVRLNGSVPRTERIPLDSLLEDIEIAATFEARNRGVELSIEPAEHGVSVQGDAQICTSIVTNLVQNACKFTRPHGHVTLVSRVTPTRIYIDVADECGGLPPGMAEQLFRPFQQRHENHTGLGLGLAISLKGVRAIGGDISVRNLPGIGCVFTVELIRAGLVQEVDASQQP
jgi:signal transduction histidine kinase